MMMMILLLGKITFLSLLLILSSLSAIDQQEVEITEGSDSVVLPCSTSSRLPEDTSVEWTRSEPEFMMVHSSSSQRKQDGFYRDRTEMNKDFLRTGDVSLTLRNPRDRDDGRYVCTVYRDQDVLRHTVVLKYVNKGQSIRSELLMKVKGHSEVNLSLFFHRTLSILGHSCAGSAGSGSHHLCRLQILYTVLERRFGGKISEKLHKSKNI
uniref:Ig-like domain-containing protein n=1 Tax=Xiphophorus maculatus TaxID=8083 RepID=A0A3B5R0Y4_XIPMA